MDLQLLIPKGKLSPIVLLLKLEQTSLQNVLIMPHARFSGWLLLGIIL
jgi:hypothetical protein